jgi:APA family basic amino acid/polyamine antiporter
VIFASWLFYGLVAGALFVFRRTRPDASGGYRAPGYPFIPIVFMLATLALIINTFIATPRQALYAAATLILGLPFYWYWARRRPESEPLG